MNTTGRYLLIVLGLVISMHYLLSFTHESYGRATSLDSLKAQLYPISPKPNTTDTELPVDSNQKNTIDNSNSNTVNTDYSEDPTSEVEHLVVDKRANATFVILCRNSDLDGTVKSIRDLEDRFNRRFQYPYVLLNEVEFTEEFKRRVSVLTDAKMEFGLIPHDHWFQPDWIDEDKAKEGREKLASEKVIYGGSVPYRNMCRFNSGFFFKHPLVQKYRWYWRVEPNVHFHCDINRDPFLYMENNNKTYSFTVTMYEYEATIPTLWSTVREFMKLHPEYIVQDNAMGFMSEDGLRYNLCHFWSNFEIADMDFWRSEAYTTFFEYLDSKGGFYYERWGDAPVHSIAASLFLNRNQIHFFDEIGYEHNPYTHCPKVGSNWVDGKCACDPGKSFDYNGYSCMSKWDRFMEGS